MSLSPGVVRAAEDENGLLAELLKSGVQVSPRVTVRLPSPTLHEGMTAQQQRRAIESVAGDRYSWEALTRKSAVAPFVLKVTSNDDDPTVSARQIDLWFVAYGKLESLQGEQFLTDQLGSLEDDENEATAVLLTGEALTRRKLPVPVASSDPRFISAKVTLLEKVQIQATTRTVATSGQNHVLAASVLAAEFQKDAESPNVWRPLVRDASGKSTPGKAQPYDGLASYLQATRLQEPSGAMLLEYHLVFAEPRGWFNGSNLLRSKLPIVSQNLVRQIRRKLAEPDRAR
ncbi:MAG: hypothetical protein U0795_03380 [Pirellulales bacterium]